MKTLIVKIILWVLALVVLSIGGLAFFLPLPEWVKCILASVIGGFSTAFLYAFIEYARARINMERAFRNDKD